MKCFKCGQGELQPVKKDGKNYAQCNNCGSKFTLDDLRNLAAQKMSIRNSQPPEREKNRNRGLTIAITTIGIFLGIFIMAGVVMILIGNSNSPENKEVSIETEAQEEKQAKTSTKNSSDTLKIDIDQCISDLKANLPLEPDYTFVRDYYIEAKDANLTITVVVDDATDPKKALDFADTLVRQLNLYANMQNNDIALGNVNFYGGLYEEYSALVGVAPASQINNPDNWFVYDAITGGKIKLKLNKQYR